MKTALRHLSMIGSQIRGFGLSRFFRFRRPALARPLSLMLEICDNVIIGGMSLVNKSLVDPGLYVDVLVRNDVTDGWGFPRLNQLGDK